MMIVKALGLKASDQVELELRDDGRFIKKKQSTSQMFEEFYGKPFDEITQNDLSPAKEINWGKDVGSEIILPNNSSLTL